MVRLTGEMYLKYFLEWRGRTCFIAKYYYVFMLLILFGRLCGTQPIVEVERERDWRAIVIENYPISICQTFQLLERLGGGDRSAL